MIGTRLGPYEIREQIGGGGMASVYRAYQPSTERDVAIKVINRTFAGDSGAVQRFQREARLIARLEHTHILPVYDFDGRHDPPYIVMRYLEGGTLKDVLKQGAMPVSEISYLIQQAGSALDYAHRQGIVHRDVKPSNIMVDREGNSFVTDFGIARLMQPHGIGTRLTDSGMIVGTPDYMSPEQAEGARDVDARADVYSLGVILFEMLTGTLPYVSDTPLGVLVEHCEAPIPSALARRPSLPPVADALLARALAKQRTERYATAGEFVEAVIAGLGGTLSRPVYLRRAAQECVILRERKRARSAGIPEADASRPSEQHRVVTALYANASEYAEVVEGLQGSEAARLAVQALWDEAGANITARHGRVFKRDEQELLALWGTDATREDDSEQAIRAALDLQSFLGGQGHILGQDIAGSLPLNVGLHTGMALIAPEPEGGTQAASGATISIANRLMQQAEGCVLITQNTYSQVRGVFDVRADVPLKLRRAAAGSSRDALNVYRVITAKARAFRLNTRGVEGVETRMVGREIELRTLQNAYLDALEDCETHVLTIAGEAGLGKSRVLYEFDNWAELRPEHFWLLQARATSETGRRPYALLRTMISLRYGIMDNDSPAVVRRKLEEGLFQQIGPGEEIAHLIGHLCGFDLSHSPFVRSIQGDPQQLAQRARRSFMRWIVLLCAAGPIVMELEDIHHADAPSLDLLAELVDEHEDLPLVVVCTARPELFVQRPEWSGGRRSRTRLDLLPLDKRASRDLAREILQNVTDVPVTLRDLLVERAEGNPYYLEELVKALIEERVIIKESEERWRVETSRLTQQNVPATLVGLLQARLDGLLYPERLTLQRAAIVGQVFYDTALAALDAADEPGERLGDPLPILRRLMERGFVSMRETTRFAGSVEYAFGSQMLRDMLTRTVVRRQQQAYNAAAAWWLIRTSGERVDEYNTMIADYYERAGEMEPAAHHLRWAGEYSLHISAFGAARASFERALLLLAPQAPLRLTLYLRLGESCYGLSDYPAAQRYLQDALDLARERHESAPTARALYWLSQVATAEGDYTRAQAGLEESLRLARAAADESIQVRILGGLATLHEQRPGELGLARAYVAECLAVARRLDVPSEILFALNRSGAVARADGDAEEAERICQQLLALAEQTGDRDWQAGALNNMAVVADMRGDTAAAQAYCLRALPLAREFSPPRFVVLLLNNLADGYIRLKDFAGARRHLHEALALSHRIGAVPRTLAVLANAGWWLAEQGHTGRGLALLGLSQYHPASYGDLQSNVAAALTCLGLDAGDPAVIAALQAGRALDLEKAVSDLLPELAG